MKVVHYQKQNNLNATKRVITEIILREKFFPTEPNRVRTIHLYARPHTIIQTRNKKKRTGKWNHLPTAQLRNEIKKARLRPDHGGIGGRSKTWPHFEFSSGVIEKVTVRGLTLRSKQSGTWISWCWTDVEQPEIPFARRRLTRCPNTGRTQSLLLAQSQMTWRSSAICRTIEERKV